MKKTILILMSILCFAAYTGADPWLVCDVYTSPIKGFKYQIDGGEWITTLYEERTFSNGETAAVVADMAGMPDGAHQLKVKAFTEWGESPTVPFDFDKSLPSQPTSIRFRMQ